MVRRRAVCAAWAFVLIVFSAWVWWMFAAGQSGLSPLRGLMALVVRLAMLGLLVMLLAEPRAVRTDDSLSVVFALDLSIRSAKPRPTAPWSSCLAP